ncbi:MAG: hypothetical protein IJJ33_04955 [Victivallales bacterium]|nr:hypothetical protein [Victivallales bacterium]
MFSIHAFRHPKAIYSPAYFWGIKGPMDVAEMKRQLQDMARLGARSVCLECVPRKMEPPYLSEDYFRVIRQVVEEAERLGMNYYLYDEGGYPSGSAYGKVWASNPERYTRSYAVMTGPSAYRIVREETHPERGPQVPDVLAPGATEKFIELTHEAYLKHLGPKYFGKLIRYTFTDEPVCLEWWPDRMGWTADLADEFRRRKGYSLEPFVQPLVHAGNCLPIPGTDLARAAIDYRDVVSQLFVERFLHPIREWCRRHHLLSGGHFGGEDEWYRYQNMGFGNILQSLRALDLPGVDMIWRQLYPGERLHPFPKLASSAAHQNGTTAVLGELYAVYGSGLKPDVMKFLLDYMLVCGVNTFVFSNRSQVLRDGGMSGCRPHFGPVNPLWKYFRPWHEYVARMSQMMNQGRADAETALYLDLRAMSLCEQPQEYAVSRAVKISDFLLESQSDFDYIDDEMLRTARIRGKRLMIGKAGYRRLIIPPGSLLTEGAEAALARIRKAGIPVYEGDEPEAAVPVLQVNPPTRSLRVTRRLLGHGQVGYFVLNTSRHPLKVQLQIAERGPVTCVSPESGELLAIEVIANPPPNRQDAAGEGEKRKRGVVSTPSLGDEAIAPRREGSWDESFAIASIDSREGRWQWEFAPLESRYFLAGVEATAQFPPKPGSVIQELQGPWTLRPIRRHVPGEHEYQVERCHARGRKTVLGDWRTLLGGSFSGDALYTLKFPCDTPDKAGFLDLGEVRYAASVTLNGKRLGSRLFSPFVFALKDSLRKGENTLKVTVTNTLANILDSEEVQKDWQTRFRLSKFEERQRSFEKESLSSGLFGPVSLRT